MKKPPAHKSKRDSLPACAVLLAGGRGTRFWPRSRARTPKQLLDITGGGTMLAATAARLRPLIPPRHIWAVTNVEQAAGVRRELPRVPASHVLAEPVGRNTAAAIGLAAIHLAREYGDALMAVLPSDHYIARPAPFRKIIHAALELAREPGNLVVLGIPPSRPETGFGYIERGGIFSRPRGIAAYSVRRFTEKPSLAVAQKYVRKYSASRKYFWNAGMFFWRASSFLECLRRFLPATHHALAEIGETIGTPRYQRTLRRIYPRLKNISVDYAIMEPATAVRPATRRLTSRPAPRVSVIPAQAGWSDIGSWAAVYELLAAQTGARSGANVSAGPSFTLDARGNYFWSTKKFVAAIGVHDLVLVETDDAILLCSRDRSQDVAKIVPWLKDRKLHDLL
ncbi:MAG: sugar phosphate nucleotidyltransferase [Candidatus Acidiferrales bacterium]